MPSGDTDTPFGKLGLTPRAAQPPAPAARPLTEISAEHAAHHAALQAAHGEAMSQDARCRVIGEAVFALATDGGEGETHLGPYLDHAAFPEGTNRCLYEAECSRRKQEPTYDITDQAPRRMARILARGLQATDREATRGAERGAAQAEVRAAEHTDRAHVVWFETTCRGSFVQAAQNADSMPVGAPPNPELVAQRQRLVQFGRMWAIAQHSTPQDAARLAQHMGQLHWERGVPSPVQFIQTTLFSAPGHDSGFSAAFQSAIAAEFDLSPHRVVTGSDYDTAMSATLRDADGQQTPVYSEEAPLRFGIGLEGYLAADGAQMMRATPEHGHAITLDVTRMSPASKGLVASYLGLWKVAEDAGETAFFLDLVQYDLRGQSVLDEFALFRAARILNHTFGGRAGYNGEIIRGTQARGMLRWQAQLRSPKGDASRSDRNRSDTRANLRALAIMDEEGEIDEEVLKAFGDYSRDHWFGAPSFETVQAHLAELFPKKVAKEGA